MKKDFSDTELWILCKFWNEACGEAVKDWCVEYQVNGMIASDLSEKAERFCREFVN